MSFVGITDDDLRYMSPRDFNISIKGLILRYALLCAQELPDAGKLVAGKEVEVVVAVPTPPPRADTRGRLLTNRRIEASKLNARYMQVLNLARRYDRQNRTHWYEKIKQTRRTKGMALAVSLGFAKVR